MMKKIYTGIERKHSVKKFIKELRISDSHYHNYGFIATYDNISLTLIQCPYGARRGFGDLLKIVKTEYPTTTKKKLLWDLKEVGLNMFWCYEVEELVFFFTDDPDSDFNLKIGKELSKDAEEDELLPNETWRTHTRGYGIYTRKEIMDNIKEYGSKQKQKSKKG